MDSVSINQIEKSEDLIPGQHYWLIVREGPGKGSTCIKKVMVDPEGGAYFGNSIWASPENPQAFQRWKIWGPVPGLRTVLNMQSTISSIQKTIHEYEEHVNLLRDSGEA